MARLLFVFVTVGLLFLGCLRLLAPSAEAGDKPTPAVSFSDKPVMVSGKDFQYFLGKPEVRQLGGRSFVVGQEVLYPKLTNKVIWPGGKVWVPLDTVTQMVELEPVKPEK